MEEELTPKSPPWRRRFRTAGRAAAALALLSGLGLLFAVSLLAFGSWAVDQLGQGIHFEGIQVRATGLRLEKWNLLKLDSANVTIPKSGVTVRAEHLHLVFTLSSWPAGQNPSALEAKLGHLHIDIDTSVHTPPDTTPFSWPDLTLPLSVHARLDTFDLSAGAKIRLLDIEARARRGQDLSMRLSRFAMKGLPVNASIQARARWSERDTVRIGGGGRVWGGCCASDSFALNAALHRKNLMQGTAGISVFIADVERWTDLLPALASAPQLGAWRLDAKVKTSKKDTSLSLHARGTMSEFYPLQAATLDLTAAANRKGTRLEASASGAHGYLLRVSLHSPLSPSHWNRRMSASGTADVSHWNMPISTYSLPLDAHGEITRVDRNGARAVVRMRSGSVIRGESHFSPLSWSFDANIVPKEPWAITWLPGLGMGENAHITGRDSAGGTAVSAVIRQPHWNHFRLDSVIAGLWLDTRHLLLPSIHTHDGERTLNGSGEVNWTDWFWQFDASPAGEPTSLAHVRGSIPGDIRAHAENFPLTFVPVPEWRAKFRDARLSADLLHHPTQFSSRDSATGSLRARPGEDSLIADFAVARRDTFFSIQRLSVLLGPDHLSASGSARYGKAGFKLDTAAADFAAIHLDRLIHLQNPHAQAGGLFSGYFRSGPVMGLQASARLDSGWVEKDSGGVTQLPQLLIWGSTDTLNVGGFYPYGNLRIPFKASLTHLFDARRDFTAVAFPGESLRFKATGHIDSLASAALDFRLDGEQDFGTTAQLRRIDASGTASALKKNGKWIWQAQAADRTTKLLAPGGNDFNLAFQLHANPEEVILDTVRMLGTRGGSAQFRGKYALASGKFHVNGKVKDLDIGIDQTRTLAIAAADVTTTQDGILHARVQKAHYRETYARDQMLDARIGTASLNFQSARDWNKLSGNVQVSSALYSRAIPEPKDFLRALTSPHHDVAVRSTAYSKPFLLDLSVSSIGDSIRVANNVAQARLSFDVAVNGPTSSPILTGSVNTSDTVSSFQYVGKAFRIEEFQLNWASQPLAQGQYKLQGSRQIRSTCSDESSTLLSTNSSDSCSVVLNSSGTLSRPQLEPPVAKTCASDATTQASIQAIALGCYPQSSATSSSSNPSYFQMGTALAVGQMRSWVNDVVNSRLKGNRDPGFAFLPDSVMFKELPRENTQDRMTLTVGKKLSERFDIEAEYTHLFTARADATSTTASSSTSSASSVAGSSTATSTTDDYTLRLRYHPPFEWVDDSAARARLTERVILQLETRQTKGWIPSNETLLKPSLRYHWEFW